MYGTTVEATKVVVRHPFRISESLCFFRDTHIWDDESGAMGGGPLGDSFLIDEDSVTGIPDRKGYFWVTPEVSEDPCRPVRLVGSLIPVGSLPVRVTPVSFAMYTQDSTRSSSTVLSVRGQKEARTPRRPKPPVNGSRTGIWWNSRILRVSRDLHDRVLLGGGTTQTVSVDVLWSGEN